MIRNITQLNQTYTKNIVIFNKKNEKESNVCRKTYSIFNTAKNVYQNKHKIQAFKFR